MSSNRFLPAFDVELDDLCGSSCPLLISHKLSWSETTLIRVGSRSKSIWLACNVPPEHRKCWVMTSVSRSSPLSLIFVIAATLSVPLEPDLSMAPLAGHTFHMRDADGIPRDLADREAPLRFMKFIWFGGAASNVHVECARILSSVLALQFADRLASTGVGRLRTNRVGAAALKPTDAAALHLADAQASFFLAFRNGVWCI
ncbi:hypothetical protein C8R46DRAFT_1044847 [Mycena filopes]|nr:hypothetical protein C8R46DRAFT_1044847 [Mycena filopes]